MNTNLNEIILKEAVAAVSIEKHILDNLDIYFGESEEMDLFIESIDLHGEDSEPEMIFEELRPNEEYEADRMRGTGHEWYMKQFLAKHPKAQEAFQKARESGEGIA